MKHFIAILIIVLASVIISIPLTKPGLYLIHDDQQVARLFLFDKALRSGQFPVRWVDSLGFGFGYPLFVFYPPLVYMVGEVFHLAGFGFIDSVKLVFFASILASGLAMYILAKELWGKLEGLTAAIFYMYVPYRAIDVYIRGALAESFSFVWLPVILWSFYKLQKTQKIIYVYLSGLFLGFLIITHNLIFLPFILLLPFYLLFLIWKSSNKKYSIIHILYSIIFAFGISAFFWIPALFEKKFTIVDDLLLVNLANYNIHFVYPQQLWNWPWGFGGSAAGLADGLSFKIGKLHILVSVAAFILSIIFLFKSKGKNLPFTIYHLPFTFFLLFILAAFMTTFYSKPIWDLIQPLQYLQFPWRFLTFTALFAAACTGAFIYLIRVPILKLIIAVVLIILLLIPNLKLFSPREYRFDLTDEAATAKETINWYVSGSSFEYLPKGVQLYRGELGTNLAAIEKDDIPKQKLEIIEGDTSVDILEEKPHRLLFNIDARNQTHVQANIFNFPGWHVKVDDQPVPINDNNKLKLITFNVAKGEHQVEIKFTNTPVRSSANSATAASILLMGFLFIKKLKYG